MAKRTYQAIQAEIEKLRKEADLIRKEEIAEVVTKIKAAIEAYGLTAKDLGLSGSLARAKPASKRAPKGSAKAKAKNGKRPVKYRDDAGNEWVGFGKRPAWFVAALAAGKTPEALLVK